MTFARALITAFMTAAFVRSDDPANMAAAAALSAMAWFFLTSDPLPGAVDRGLQCFARRYRHD